MPLRIVAGLGVVVVLGVSAWAGTPPAQPPLSSIVRVLHVSEVDKDSRRIVFYQTAQAVLEEIENGKKVRRVRPVTVGAAFSLKKGKVITAGGKPVREQDVWKRLKSGDLVVIMRDMGPPEEGEEDPSLRYRKLFRDDVLILIGELESVK
jgi:hypothetical protein